MSEFTCRVVQLGKIGKHPNADSLSIWNGPQGPIVFRTGDFNEGQLACFVPVDAMVPVDRSEFSFLAQKSKNGVFRVRGIKLRGIPSVGLLVRCPDGVSAGDNLADYFGVTKYEEPQDHSFGTDSVAVAGPSVPIYDIENYWNLTECIVDGTETMAPDYVCEWSVSEKIHGCNGKFLFQEGVQHVGSRSRWVAQDGQNVWSTAFSKNEWLQALCKRYEGICFYGEVYGRVQDLKYGLENDVDVKLFDGYITKTGQWLSRLELELIAGQRNCVNTLMKNSEFNSMSLDRIVELAKTYLSADRNSTIDGKTMMQGVVIRPMTQSKMLVGPKYTRLITKVVSEQYLSRKNPTESH